MPRQWTFRADTTARAGERRLLGRFLEAVPTDLSGRGPGQVVAKLDQARDLVVGDAVLAVADDLYGGAALADDHQTPNELVPVRARRARDDDVRDLRVAADR